MGMFNRRSGKERRGWTVRRAFAGEKCRELERRGGRDRRSGKERRVSWIDHRNA